MTEDKSQANWFVRVLLMVLVAFISVLVLLSFLKKEPAFAISPSIVTLLALMSVVILSESFNNLSLGRILSLSREVKKVSTERTELKGENDRLRESLIQVATNIQSQVNTTIQAQGTDLLQLLGVKKAEEPEEEEEDETAPIPQSATPDARSQRIPLYKIMRSIEGEAIERFLSRRNLPSEDLIREIQFTEALKGLDPIMDKRLVFDGFLKTPQKEHFFEVKVHDRLSPMIWDRFYVMLSKLLLYRQAKNVPAEMTLILAKLPVDEDRPKSFSSTERFLQAFQPAISNGLLRIETIKFSQDDYERLVIDREKATQQE